MGFSASRHTPRAAGLLSEAMAAALGSPCPADLPMLQKLISKCPVISDLERIRGKSSVKGADNEGSHAEQLWGRFL